MYIEWLDIFDFLFAPIYFVFFVFLAVAIKNRNIRKKPYYRYYVPALICKMIGGSALCLIYTYYYKEGGDSVNYYLAAKAYSTALFNFDLETFYDMVTFWTHNIQSTGYIEKGYGYVFFAHTDYYALTTAVLSVPFCVAGFGCYIPTTLVLDFFSFLALWKLYEVFVSEFPQLHRQFAIAIFFIPSLFFWGSGLLKDTYTISALGVATYCIYKYIIKKQRKTKYLITMIISLLMILLIKPYIFFAIIPGSLIWVFFNRLVKIKNPVVRTLFLPFTITISVGLILVILQSLGDYLGDYSLDRILEKAVKTQQDLVRNQHYGSNFYDIGAFEPTVTGILSKIPAAMNLALFMPYIWHANNPVMLLAGLENLFMLGFSIFILLRVKLSVLFKSLFSHPLLIFAFLFSLFFAFSVGLTTANYGALVRLKIPCIPFYLSSLFILYHLNRESFRRK